MPSFQGNQLNLRSIIENGASRNVHTIGKIAGSQTQRATCNQIGFNLPGCQLHFQLATRTDLLEFHGQTIQNSCRGNRVPDPLRIFW